ncbi:MAG: hypothetical protein NT074_01770 [Methanomicrobiales archaeon]|nr:hypothetical protein [Methanomicrobiales archaeon]
MEKSVRKQVSLACFILGFVLLLVQDLKGFATLNFGWSWPLALMFYIGLVLIITGYFLRG